MSTRNVKKTKRHSGLPLWQAAAVMELNERKENETERVAGGDCLSG